MDEASSFSLYVPSNYHDNPPSDPSLIVNRKNVFQCETLYMYVYAHTKHPKGSTEYSKWYTQQSSLEVEVNLESVLVSGGNADQIIGSSRKNEGSNALLTPMSIMSEVYRPETIVTGIASSANRPDSHQNNSDNSNGVDGNHSISTQTNSTCSWSVIPLDAGDIVYLVKSSLRRLSTIDDGVIHHKRTAPTSDATSPMPPTSTSTVAPSQTPITQSSPTTTSTVAQSMQHLDTSESESGVTGGGMGIHVKVSLSSWANTDHVLHNNTPTEKERFLEEVLTDILGDDEPMTDVESDVPSPTSSRARSPVQSESLQGARVSGVFVNNVDNALLRTKPMFAVQMDCVLRVKTAPRIAYKQSTIGNIRYISIRLENSDFQPITVRDCQLYITAANDPKALNTLPKPCKMEWHVSRRWDDFPVVLDTFESVSVVFAVEPYSADTTGVENKTKTTNTLRPQIYDSKVSIALSVSPLLERRQFLELQYQLLAANAIHSELSISVKVPEVVHSKSMFTVHFTIANTTSKTRDVSLILHQPRRSDATSKDKTLLTDARGVVLLDDELADAQAIMLEDESVASLVCLDETVYLGRVDANTTKLAAVNFFAFRVGSYELALAHLYDHPSKSFLSAKCPSTYVYVSESVEDEKRKIPPQHEHKSVSNKV
eukprot:CFRG8599T1